MTASAARLYRSFAAPVFSAATPLAPIDEREPGRQWNHRFHRCRTVGVAHEMTGNRAQNRGVILRAAARADAGVAGERAERASVLDASEITRERVERGDVLAIRRMLLEPIDLREHGEDRDDQRRRTAHPGRARQIARERDIGAAQSMRDSRERKLRATRRATVAGYVRHRVSPA